MKATSNDPAVSVHTQNISEQKVADSTKTVRSRRQLLRSLRFELQNIVEAIVGHIQMLREDAKDHTKEMVRGLDNLLGAAKDLYVFIKMNLDVDWPELETSDFYSRLRTVRHDIANQLNLVTSECQFLILDEAEHQFGAFLNDLERIRDYCRDCEATLSRYKNTDDDSQSRRFDSPQTDSVLFELTHRAAAPRNEPSEPANILIVDDSEITRDVMAKLVRREGHQVATAASGQEALDVLLEGDFDLVLLDFLMPGMNGFEVLGRLKSDERLRHTPVIMISALDAAADMVPCIELGADDYLTKPLDFSLLKARLNASVERKRLREREFGQFFTPELARHFIRHPELITEGREADVTVLFCDIRGFSRISERLGPADTVRWLSDVMSTLSDCVINHRGVLVDFIGDELMAMWGAPEPQANHAELACLAATEMLERLASIDQRWGDVVMEPTQVGIGLNSGIAQVGNTGTARKFKYGPLGNTVNLASRVQGATKFLAAKMVVTGATQRRLKGRFGQRRLCKVRVVNIQEPVDLYELRPLDRDKKALFIQRYEEALGYFERRQFRKATSALGRLLADDPDDGPALLLMSRIVEAILKRSEEFDPVWDLPGK